MFKMIIFSLFVSIFIKVNKFVTEFLNGEPNKHKVKSFFLSSNLISFESVHLNLHITYEVVCSVTSVQKNYVSRVFELPFYF